MDFSRLILSLSGLWSLNDKINLEKSKGLPKERTQKRSRKKQAQKEKDKATKPTTPKQRKNEEKKQEQKRRKGGKDKNRKRRKFPNIEFIENWIQFRQFILCGISDCEKWYIENQQSGNEDYGTIK